MLLAVADVFAAAANSTGQTPPPAPTSSSSGGGGAPGAPLAVSRHHRSGGGGGGSSALFVAGLGNKPQDADAYRLAGARALPKTPPPRSVPPSPLHAALYCGVVRGGGAGGADHRPRGRPQGVGPPPVGGRPAPPPPPAAPLPHVHGPEAVALPDGRGGRGRQQSKWRWCWWQHHTHITGPLRAVYEWEATVDGRLLIRLLIHTTPPLPRLRALTFRPFDSHHHHHHQCPCPCPCLPARPYIRAPPWWAVNPLPPSRRRTRARSGTS